MTTQIESGKCYQLIYRHNPKFHVKCIEYKNDTVIYHGDWISAEDKIFRKDYFMLYCQFVTPLQELPLPSYVTEVTIRPKSQIRLIRR